LYPESSPLAKGEISMKYMTAKEEDILTNANYIRQGVVIDKLLQSLIVTPIDYNELLVGDKNAIMVAARVLGYGKDYTFTYNNKEVTVDLSTLEDKKVDESLFNRGVNEFTFTTPKVENTLTFKLLTHGDEKKIEAEVNGMKKVNPEISTDITTRLKHMITSVNGERDQKAIRDFVDNSLLAPDARALREYYGKITPDVNLVFKPEDGNYTGEGIAVPVNLNFFWPDLGL
jgi:translation initiation factor IF-3